VYLNETPHTTVNLGPVDLKKKPTSPVQPSGWYEQEEVQRREVSDFKIDVRSLCVEAAQEYDVKLRLQYETVFGQSLYVMGNIPELGQWKELVCPMTWTKGHYWET